MKLPIDQIEAGMELAADVLNLNGGLLLGKGIRLNLRHVGILKTWGVEAVHVTAADGGEQSEGAAMAGWTAEERARAGEEVERRFRHVRCQLESVVRLRDLAAERLAARRARQRLRGGEVPV